MKNNTNNTHADLNTEFDHSEWDRIDAEDAADWAYRINEFDMFVTDRSSIIIHGETDTQDEWIGSDCIVPLDQ
jgi:hypothetical protein